VEGSKRIRFPITGNFVLDTSGESSVKVILESGFSPLGARGESVELHEILRDSLTIAHPEILELGLGFAFGVVRSKVDLQLGYKLLIVGEPDWLVDWIGFEESGFEPI
jgi:hypothetical protein